MTICTRNRFNIQLVKTAWPVYYGVQLNPDAYAFDF
jgi:hypothetical protein